MNPLVFLRFDEPAPDASISETVDDSLPPIDAAGSVDDLLPIGAHPPAIVDSWLGRGRLFTAGAALANVDLDPGASLSTRDLTIRVVLKWNLALQASTGGLGAIVVRGKGNSPTERTAYGLELRVVSAGAMIAEVRMWWQDVAGVTHVQDAAQFAALPGTEYVMITATRRWVSSTEVYVRYFIGDKLAGEFLSVDGDIGGDVYGSLVVGAKFTAGVASNYLEAIVDELQIFDEDMSAEEIAATWDRFTRQQPDGYTMIRQLFPPGAPISGNPKSAVQKLLRVAGHSFGYARAQIENFRANQLPNRAYGVVLEEWERATDAARRIGDDFEKRRARVIARFRKLAGSSVEGVRTALSDLLQLAPPQIEILAFSNRRSDSFATIDPLVFNSRTNVDGGGTVTWSAAGTLHAVAATGQNLSLEAGRRRWATCFTEVGGDGRDASFMIKLSPTTLAPGCEAGIAFENWTTREKVLLGLRNSGGSYFVVLEHFNEAGVSDQVAIVTAGLPLATTWLHLACPVVGQQDFHAPRGGVMRAGYSQISGVVPTLERDALTTFGAARFTRAGFQWAGPYVRSIGGSTTGAGVVVDFDDALWISPYGDRPLHWYAYRDPALPGPGDISGGEAVFSDLAQAQTEAHVTLSKIARCDDPLTGCDRTPMGAV